MKKSSYVKDDYVRVTSALSIIRKEFLEQWRGKYGNEHCDKIMHESIRNGKHFHSMCKEFHTAVKNKVPFPEYSEIVSRLSSDPEKGSDFYNYQVWFESNVEEILHIEERFNNDQYMFCGQPDLAVIMKVDHSIAIIDEKYTNSIDENYRYQLAAYSYLDIPEIISIDKVRRIVLQCKNEFKAVEYKAADNAKDFRVFLNALALYRAIKLKQ